MIKPNLATLSASMLVASMLAACGGGGGGGNSSTGTSSNSGSGTGTTPAVSAAITLLPPATTSIPAYTPTGDVATDSFDWLNNVRQSMSLHLLTSNSAVTQASQNHANYLVANDMSGHYETAGLTDFTGIDPFTRVSALYSTSMVGEVVVAWSGSFPDSLGAVEALFDAPFHRIGMLSDYSVAGAAYATGSLPGNALVPYSAMNIDLASNAGTLAENQFVVYPYSGQQGAGYQWIANESPNPFNNDPGYIGDTVGYPVTLQGKSSDALTISSFAISSNGSNIPCLEVDPATANIGSELLGAAMCIPYQPLQPGTPYSATVSGTKNGQSFTVSWTWTTEVAAVSAKALTPRPGHPLNMTINARMN